MNDGKPHIRDVLHSLNQVTGTEWCEVRRNATMCLAFNTDLTDHTVLPTEASMWPVRTRFVAPVAHDEDGSHDTWWDKTKGFFNAVEDGARHGLNYVENHPLKSLAYAGMVVFAVTPMGWFVDGVAGISAGTGLLIDSAVAIRSAQIGETLMEESNLFYQLKGATQGAQQIGRGFAKVMPQMASFGAVFANNWEHTEDDSFEDHFYKAIIRTGDDLSKPIAFNSLIHGGIGVVTSGPKALARDEEAVAKLKKSLGMAFGGAVSLAGLSSVDGVYKALKNG